MKHRYLSALLAAAEGGIPRPAGEVIEGGETAR
jgi:hypothetical protein